MTPFFSDEAWNSLPLPLAIKDTLRATCSALKSQLQNVTVPKPVCQAKPVDTRPLTQVIFFHEWYRLQLFLQIEMVVFDISSSMNSHSFDPSLCHLMKLT